jgi:myo-inositol 2-dehydrogenase/D-chiro-inositol 1-dehydrogenase
MPDPIRVAVVGVGRMGAVHAFHVQELGRETGMCRLAAVVDANGERARAVLSRLGAPDTPVLASVEELAAANVSDASFIVTTTENHRQNATVLIEAGQRVLMEKPLTGSVGEDRDFCGQLDARHPNAIMLAFQRRFDPALQHAKKLMADGAIGRVFKIFSALEDSGPPPDGYKSGGILPDMSVHNVDELLWLTGKTPVAAASIGNRHYNHRISTVEEDFDDAFMYLWFEGELSGQVTVSRNHVPGYRVETTIFGEQGFINVGHFDRERFHVNFEAYGRGRTIEKRVFPTRDYGEPMPEFVDRFGHAYKEELRVFLECCASGAAFPTNHHDGLRSMEVIAAAMRARVEPSASGRI